MQFNSVDPSISTREKPKRLQLIRKHQTCDHIEMAKITSSLQIQNLGNFSCKPLLIIGTVAFAFLRLKQCWKSLRIQKEIAEVRRKAKEVGGSSPAKVMVIGLQHHGKSSLINSVFRVMYRETGEELLLRSETGPLLARQTTVKYKPYDVLESPQGSRVLFTLIDSPPFSTLPQHRALLRQKMLGIPAVRYQVEVSGSNLMDHHFLEERELRKADCVILCVNSAEAATEQHVGIMAEKMADFLRAAGVPFVVAMTNRDEALSRGLPLASLMEYVSTKTSTNAVFCLTNYCYIKFLEGRHDHAKNIDMNTIEFNLTVTQLLKQVLEFSKQRRRQQQEDEGESSSLPTTTTSGSSSASTTTCCSSSSSSKSCSPISESVQLCT